MKFLFDLFPVILFFIAFKLGGSYAAPGEAIYVATTVAIVATFLQIGWSWFRHRKVDTMLWMSLVIITVFGGMTLIFHDETFIKWKPTVLYWSFAGALAGSAVLLKKNLIRAVLAEQRAALRRGLHPEIDRLQRRVMLAEAAEDSAARANSSE